MRAFVPLAALAAMVALAACQADPAAAETRYLAVLAAAVLVPVGALAPRPAVELALGAVLVTAAVWALPPSPTRGAVVAALLAAALAVAAARALARTGLPLAAAVALALGLQVLLRGEMLLSPESPLRAVVALVGLPLAAGAAAAVLANRWGAGPAALAGGTAALLAPGFNVASTLALVALAAGDLAGRPGLDRRLRGVALLGALAPIAWEPRAGTIAAAAGLVLAFPRAGTIVAALAAVMAMLFPVRELDESLRLLAWLPMLLPLLPVALARRDRERLPLAAASLLLVIAAARAVPGEAALAAPLALGGLAIRREGAAAGAQRVWTAALLGLAALLAAYPWLRAEPAREALALLGLEPAPRAVAAVLAAALGVAGAAALADRRSSAAPTRAAALAGGLAAGAVVLALALALPPAGSLLAGRGGAVLLDGSSPRWQAEVPPRPVTGVIVESNLSNSAAVPPGAPVATLRLADDRGETFEWTLRAGRDSGEWAARRPDLEGLEAPEPWISFVAGDFFGQRYRGRWTLAEPRRIVRVELERRPDLPPDLALALYQVEVRP